ncbi:hypothetical protein JCM16408A_38970 [Methylobacterium phyllosphaerae]
MKLPIRSALFMICSIQIRSAMHPGPETRPAEIRLREAEAIAFADHPAAKGDGAAPRPADRLIVRGAMAMAGRRRTISLRLPPAGPSL